MISLLFNVVNESSFDKFIYIKKITVIGLLFLFIETKELCEARAKSQCSAN